MLARLRRAWAAFRAEPPSAQGWLARHQNEVYGAYAGKWVAIGRFGVVAASVDFDEIYRRSKRAGLRDPVVFKVPTQDGLRRRHA